MAADQQDAGGGDAVGQERIAGPSPGLYLVRLQDEAERTTKETANAAFTVLQILARQEIRPPRPGEGGRRKPRWTGGPNSAESVLHKSP